MSSRCNGLLLSVSADVHSADAHHRIRRCYGPGESNQRWKYDTVMGHIASEQAGTLATPLVFTVCAAKKAGGAGGVGVAAAEQ